MSDCVCCEAKSVSTAISEDGVAAVNVDSPTGDDSLTDGIALDSISSIGERLQEIEVITIDMQSRYVGNRIGPSPRPGSRSAAHSGPHDEFYHGCQRIAAAWFGRNVEDGLSDALRKMANSAQAFFISQSFDFSKICRIFAPWL